LGINGCTVSSNLNTRNNGLYFTQGLANRFLDGELDFGWERFHDYELRPVVWRDGELAEDREEYVGDGVWCDAVDGGLECFTMALSDGG
jgi:hypothetical protein